MFELSWRAGWWRMILKGGTPEAEATFRAQLGIVGMNGTQTLVGGCSTRRMLYLVYAVLGVYCTQC